VYLARKCAIFFDSMPLGENDNYSSRTANHLFGSGLFAMLATSEFMLQSNLKILELVGTPASLLDPLKAAVTVTKETRQSAQDGQVFLI
jgi:hypothetical protein